MALPLIGTLYPKGESVANADRTMWEISPNVCARVLSSVWDIIKTTYTGSPDTMVKVVESCPARVVIQGGDSCKTLDEFT
jgi:DhnA family fructose-bisphosphate aldolase class Ia